MNQPIPLPHGGPVRSQATAIEQSRAASQVFAAVIAGHERPRNTQLAIAEMTEACRQKALAERAFYRYSRSGSQVTGASVQLARELARCWGNIDYGITELDRNDVTAESEMMAFAWDLQTNARVSNTFIVKHSRDTRDGAKQLTDQRDVYENNANMGARRVREAIFAVLPVWLVEQAKELCLRTMADGGGQPLAARIAKAVDLFASIGVSTAQLEAKIARSTGAWTAYDLASLTVVYQAIQRGESAKDDEFPPAEQVVTVGELAPAPATTGTRRRASKAAAKVAPEPPPAEEADEETLRRREQQEMEAELAEQDAADDTRGEQ